VVLPVEPSDETTPSRQKTNDKKNNKRSIPLVPPEEPSIVIFVGSSGRTIMYRTHYGPSCIGIRDRSRQTWQHHYVQYTLWPLLHRDPGLKQADVVVLILRGIELIICFDRVPRCATETLVPQLHVLQLKLRNEEHGQSVRLDQHLSNALNVLYYYIIYKISLITSYIIHKISLMYSSTTLPVHSVEVEESKERRNEK
jgi:hypothetical protein